MIRRTLNAVDAVAARAGALATSPRAVLVIWGAIIALVFVSRSFLFPGADADDSEQLVCMQQWALSCGPRNPPLFTWLGILSQTIFGTTITAVIVVKCAVIAGCLLCVYAAGTMMLQDRGLAALAALCPIAIYYFSWDAAFHYTHSVMVAFAVAFSFYLLLVLENRRDALAYFLFGLSIAVGALSKLNYLMFLAAMLIAMAMDRDLRALLLNWRMPLAVLFGLALASPYYIWLWTERAWAMSLARDRFNPGVPEMHFFDVAGLGELVMAVLNFALPLLIFLIVFFPRAWWRDGARPAASTRYRRLLERAYLIMLVAAVVSVFVLGASRVRTHYMFAIILFPLLVIARVQAAEVSRRAINYFSVVLIFFAVVVPTGILVKYAIDPLRGSKAYYHIPYAKIAEKLKEAGFREGTIIGDTLGYPLGGNMLPYFPDSRVVTLLDWQLDLPENIRVGGRIPLLPADHQGQCLLLWTPDSDGYRKRVTVERAQKLLGAEIPSDPKPNYIETEIHNGGGRIFKMGYYLTLGTGNCR